MGQINTTATNKTSGIPINIININNIYLYIISTCGACIFTVRKLPHLYIIEEFCDRCKTSLREIYPTTLRFTEIASRWFYKNFPCKCSRETHQRVVRALVDDNDEFQTSIAYPPYLIVIQSQISLNYKAVAYDVAASLLRMHTPDVYEDEISCLDIPGLATFSGRAAIVEISSFSELDDIHEIINLDRFSEEYRSPIRPELLIVVLPNGVGGPECWATYHLENYYRVTRFITMERQDKVIEFNLSSPTIAASKPNMHVTCHDIELLLSDLR